MFTKSRSLIVYLLLSLPLAAAALDRIELLPPQAKAHLRISDTHDFWNKLKQSSIGKLWVDDPFQDFLGNPDAETWQEFFFDGESSAEDKVFMDQLKMLQGEVIIGFDKKYKAPYVIAELSQDNFMKSLEMDLTLREITAEPFDIHKSTFQDVEIIQYIENGGTPQEESSWQAHLKDTLVFGYSKEWIERSIVQLKKDEIEPPTGNPTLSLKIPLAQLIQNSLLEDMKNPSAAAAPYQPEALLEALGLMGIENFSTRIELKDTEMVVDNNLQISDLTKGLFAILDVEPSELPTLDFIPEHIASLEVGRFNLLHFWQEIPTVLATAMPSVKPQFDFIMATVQQQTGINLETDLLSHIGTKYISFSEASGESQISVVAVELRDAAAFKIGLETALNAPALQPQVSASLEIEPFIEHTLYTVKNPDPNEVMAFAVTDGYLLYGQPDGLRQVIRRQTSTTQAPSTFERSPLVKGLRETVPKKAFGYSVIDWKTNMDIIVRELNKPEYTSMIQQSWARSGSALPPPDFNKLPSADHIASFFNRSYQYAEASNDGIHQRIILKY
jgi:hypothetical protein